MGPGEAAARGRREFILSRTVEVPETRRVMVHGESVCLGLYSLAMRMLWRRKKVPQSRK